MLIIRGTLQLNSLTPLKTTSDMLSRKIPENYRLTESAVTARDLLHMTMLPAEVYVQEGGGTTVSVNQRVTVTNERKLELINSFFNRILLLHTGSFTYQDEVFVSRFLRNIGITDTAEFVSQVRKLLEQNVHVTSLLKLYRAEGTRIRSLAVQLAELYKESSTETRTEETAFPQARYFLQQEIFRRLDTAFLNHFLYDTRKYVSLTQGQVSGQEAVRSEQLQMADSIRLAELKQLVLMEEQPPVYRQFRFYEQIPVPAEQASEKTVMKYLGASVLSNLISQMSWLLLEKQENQTLHWTDYRRALYGSSENTLQRFLELHGEQYSHYRSDSYMEAVNHLYRNEEQVLMLFTRYLSRENRELYPACRMVHALYELQNQEKQAEELLYQNTLPAAPTLWEGLPGEQPHRDVLMVLMEAEKRLRRQSGKLSDLFFLQNRELFGESEPGEERAAADAKDALQTVQPPERRMYHEFFRETVQNRFLTEEDYRSYLDEVNERNVRNQMLLARSRAEKPAPRTIAVDRKTAMQKSLEALTQPQKVLEEMLSGGQPIEPLANPEIERLLALAEEPVQNLYRQILYPGETEMRKEYGEGTVPEERLRPAGEIRLTFAEPEQLREILREAQSSALAPAVFRVAEAGGNTAPEGAEGPAEAAALTRREEAAGKQLTHVAGQDGSPKRGDGTIVRQEGLVQQIRRIARESRRIVSNLAWTPSEQSQTGKERLRYTQARGAAAQEAGDTGAGGERQAVFLTGQTKPGNQIGEAASDLLRRAQADAETGQTGAVRTEVLNGNQPSTVNLVFRQEQAPIEEEIIEQITRNSRAVSRQQENTVEVLKNSTVIQEQLQETRQEILAENRKTVTELIQRSLQTQMNTISDQVYRNLERRLSNERKRRGY